MKNVWPEAGFFWFLPSDKWFGARGGWRLFLLPATGQNFH
jgi:hypothetical protein